jgi:hypothetical protein
MSTDWQFDQPRVYHIRVKGILDNKWSDWFNGLAILPQVNGETLLTGPVPDQAALYGLLNKLRDTGLTLLSINSLEVEEGE